MKRTRGAILAIALATGTTVGVVGVNAGAEDLHPVHHSTHHHLCHTDHEGVHHNIAVSSSREASHLDHGDQHGFCE